MASQIQETQLAEALAAASAARDQAGEEPGQPGSDHAQARGIPPTQQVAPVSIGRIVHYRLTEKDVGRINKRRADFQKMRHSIADTGLQAHIGTAMQPGDALPMIVVAIFAQSVGGARVVNGQVFLDGSDTLHKTSVPQGSEPGHWDWPQRV